MKCPFLFPRWADHAAFSRFLLAARIIFGLLMLSHGVQKWSNFSAMTTQFPDVIGLGSETSLCLVIFAEVFCSVAVIFGFLFRLSLIPVIITLMVAFIAAHGASFAQGGELAFAYLMVFVLLYVAGPGRYSLDNVIARKVGKPRD